MKQNNTSDSLPLRNSCFCWCRGLEALNLDPHGPARPDDHPADGLQGQVPHVEVLLLHLCTATRKISKPDRTQGLASDLLVRPIQGGQDVGQKTIKTSPPLSSRARIPHHTMSRQGSASASHRSKRPTLFLQGRSPRWTDLCDLVDLLHVDAAHRLVHGLLRPRLHARTPLQARAHTNKSASRGPFPLAVNAWVRGRFPGWDAWDDMA
jgi:hypothetical protein